MARPENLSPAIPEDPQRQEFQSCQQGTVGEPRLTPEQVEGLIEQKKILTVEDLARYGYFVVPHCEGDGQMTNPDTGKPEMANLYDQLLHFDLLIAPMPPYRSRFRGTSNKEQTEV